MVLRGNFNQLSVKAIIVLSSLAIVLFCLVILVVFNLPGLRFFAATNIPCQKAPPGTLLIPNNVTMGWKVEKIYPSSNSLLYHLQITPISLQVCDENGTANSVPPALGLKGEVNYVLNTPKLNKPVQIGLKDTKNPNPTIRVVGKVQIFAPQIKIVAIVDASGETGNPGFDASGGVHMDTGGDGGVGADGFYGGGGGGGGSSGDNTIGYGGSGGYGYKSIGYGGDGSDGNPGTQGGKTGTIGGIGGNGGGMASCGKETLASVGDVGRGGCGGTGGSGSPDQWFSTEGAGGGGGGGGAGGSYLGLFSFGQLGFDTGAKINVSGGIGGPGGKLEGASSQNGDRGEQGGTGSVRIVQGYADAQLNQNNIAATRIVPTSASNEILNIIPYAQNITAVPQPDKVIVTFDLSQYVPSSDYQFEAQLKRIKRGQTALEAIDEGAILKIKHNDKGPYTLTDHAIQVGTEYRYFVDLRVVYVALTPPFSFGWRSDMITARVDYETIEQPKGTIWKILPPTFETAKLKMNQSLNLITPDTNLDSEGYIVTSPTLAGSIPIYFYSEAGVDKGTVWWPNYKWTDHEPANITSKTHLNDVEIYLSGTNFTDQLFKTVSVNKNFETLHLVDKDGNRILNPKVRIRLRGGYIGGGGGFNYTHYSQAIGKDENKIDIRWPDAVTGMSIGAISPTSIQLKWPKIPDDPGPTGTGKATKLIIKWIKGTPWNAEPVPFIDRYSENLININPSETKFYVKLSDFMSYPINKTTDPDVCKQTGATDNFTKVVTFDSNNPALETTIEGLEPNLTKYYFAAIACDGNNNHSENIPQEGKGLFAQTGEDLDTLPPDNVTRVQIIGIKDQSVTLQWNQVGDWERKEVYHAKCDYCRYVVKVLKQEEFTSAGDSWDQAYNQNLGKDFPTNNISITLNDLDPGITYHFAVKAIDAQSPTPNISAGVSSPPAVAQIYAPNSNTLTYQQFNSGTGIVQKDKDTQAVIGWVMKNGFLVKDTVKGTAGLDVIKFKAFSKTDPVSSDHPFALTSSSYYFPTADTADIACKDKECVEGPITSNLIQIRNEPGVTYTIRGDYKIPTTPKGKFTLFVYYYDADGNPVGVTLLNPPPVYGVAKELDAIKAEYDTFTSSPFYNNASAGAFTKTEDKQRVFPINAQYIRLGMAWVNNSGQPTEGEIYLKNLEINETLATNSTVKGRVTYKNLPDQGIAGVTVNAKVGDTVYKSATTNINGDYSIENIALGNYTIEFNNPNAPVDVERTSQQKSNINVPADTTVDKINFEYTALFSVAGTVKTTADTLLSDVTVDLLDQTGAAISGKTAVTGDDGKYEFKDLEGGLAYTVRATAKLGQVKEPLQSTYKIDKLAANTSTADIIFTPFPNDVLSFNQVGGNFINRGFWILNPDGGQSGFYYPEQNQTDDNRALGIKLQTGTATANPANSQKLKGFKAGNNYSLSAALTTEALAAVSRTNTQTNQTEYPQVSVSVHFYQPDSKNPGYETLMPDSAQSLTWDLSQAYANEAKTKTVAIPALATSLDFQILANRMDIANLSGRAIVDNITLVEGGTLPPPPIAGLTVDANTLIAVATLYALGIDSKNINDPKWATAYPSRIELMKTVFPLAAKFDKDSANISQEDWLKVIDLFSSSPAGILK